jgi:hypothetical protein
MADIFTNLLTKGAKQGILPAKTADARNWFRDQAQQASSTSSRTIANAAKNTTNGIRTNIKPGEMYFFQYDAKLKKELPYWDKFPLIFPVEEAPNGFYGLNFHYLPYIPPRAVYGCIV